jgi:two-component system, NarL family, invasion response regulator UvrY
MKKAGEDRLRVLIAEDHASTRLGVKQILRDEFPLIGFGEAPDAATTFALLDKEHWNLLLLDITLPDRQGLEALHEIKRRWPALPVLIYSAHAEDQFAAHALRAGASGYLTKERAPEELCAAVRTILVGGKYVSPSLAGRLTKGWALDRSETPHEALSTREFQVLRLTAAGKAGKAIAVELHLSPKTVSTYRARILKKLRFESVAELVQYAVRRGLL